MSSELVTDRSRTLEEFKQLVESSDTKYEYIDGEVWEWEMMAGATPPHNRIAGNVQRQLDNRFVAKGVKCATLNSDTYVSIPGERTYRFPDVSVVCDSIEGDDFFSLAVVNPTALIEVISESSKDADRGSKFKRYSKIQSLRVYMTLEQDYPQCYVHARESSDAQWLTTVYFQLGSIVNIPYLDIEVPLAEFYRDLKWLGKEVKVVPGAGLPTYERPRG